MNLVQSKITSLLLFSTFCVLFLSACQKQTQACEPSLSSNSNASFYCQALHLNLQPKLSPDYAFPTSYQYLNGCFVYAVSHILKYKGVELDVYEAEKRTGKPREELWDMQSITNLAEAYDLELKWSNSAEYLFELLVDGEPVLLQYLIPFEGGTVGHVVAAYSFDEKGIWVSDSLKGKTDRVPYENLFKPDGKETLLSFAQVEKRRTE